MQAVSRMVGLSVSAAAITIALGTDPALAHHSAARFDISQTVAFEGVVTGLRWANPHVYLTVEQTTDAGETIEWEIETVGPSALRRLGWSQDTLSVGDRVSLRGNPARNGEHSLNLGTLEHGALAYNAMSLFREYTSPGATPESGATSLDGTWAVLLNFGVIGPFIPGQPGPELTEAGAAALAAFDEATMLPALQCVQSPAPYFMFIPDVKQVSTEGDVVRIVGDYDGGERTIHMDAADHAGATPSVHGHSIGRWEGDTLVIDTTHFSPLAMAHAYGVPSSDQKHLVERLTRNEDGTRIAYHFEVSDPEFLAAPITGDVEWAYRPDLKLEQASCDPQNARRFTGQ